VRIGNREVKLTNLDKVFFPERGLTKGDLVRHYVDVAPYLLPTPPPDAYSLDDCLNLPY
jgi:bifunctional non-homologous end joining protein LigD